MEYAVVCVVALLAGALTLITGFGLGTLLMPAFAAFFPPEVAVGATAVVHLANSLFKLAAIGRWARWSVVWAFGVPAIAGAALGAVLLAAAAAMPVLAVYSVGPIDARVTPVGLLVGVMIIGFAAFETMEQWSKRPKAGGGTAGGGGEGCDGPAPGTVRAMSCVEGSERAGGGVSNAASVRWLTIGGLISGFFGGLSGHQGALRTIFLVRAGLEPREFAGTGSTISAMVDLTRLAIYAAGAAVFSKNFGAAGGVSWWLIAAACVAAFAGSVVGAQIIRKVTMTQVRRVVAVALAVLGVLVAAGVI